ELHLHHHRRKLHSGHCTWELFSESLCSHTRRTSPFSRPDGHGKCARFTILECASMAAMALSNAHPHSTDGHELALPMELNHAAVCCSPGGASRADGHAAP